jgi:alpha/beta superfamily hydrolase|tara:strand:+ start:5524 stop:6171 length:648 start_codon:yes stop_codon:yes gene_type:complete
MAEIIFNGPDGRLEGRYHKSTIKDAPIAVVLHPHPLHGGNMNNRVVYTLYNAFADSGFSVLRFNFRGVGRSQGSYDSGAGELSDAAYAFDWLQQVNTTSNLCWIGGYSFGALIAMQLMMRRPEIEGFVSVAPPADSEDFSFLAPCPSSGIIIHGEDDTNVPLESVKKLASKLDGQKNISVRFQSIKGTDHFFKDKIEELSSAASTYIQGALTSDD